MRKRILFWALAGFLVGCGWTAYAFFTAPDVEVQLSAADRIIRTVAYLTCPAIATGLRWYWILPLNAAIYGLIGLLWQARRREPK
jgi:hypothetical protein